MAIEADNQGLRYDEGKPEFHLIPADALRELGKVYTSGAKKYAPYNWERGMNWSRCYNSLLRHLYAFWEGEKHDAETGHHHMAHAAWNAIALLAYSVRGIGVDDRRSTVGAGRAVEQSGVLGTAERLTRQFQDELNEKMNQTSYGDVAKQILETPSVSPGAAALPNAPERGATAKQMPELEDDGRTIPFGGGGFSRVGAALFFTHDPNEQASTLLKILESNGVIEVWDPVKRERLTTLARNIVGTLDTR